jgi:hypothetical protein
MQSMICSNLEKFNVPDPTSRKYDPSVFLHLWINFMVLIQAVRNIAKLKYFVHLNGWMNLMFLIHADQ